MNANASEAARSRDQLLRTVLIVQRVFSPWVMIGLGTIIVLVVVIHDREGPLGFLLGIIPVGLVAVLLSFGIQLLCGLVVRKIALRGAFCPTCGAPAQPPAP